MTITRFAPSPNGPLHLGHAYSAIVAHDLVAARAGRFLLRIEDIDGGRSRSELPEQFRADLAWLGLEWEEVAAQSTRIEAYEAAAETLRGEGLLYPCSCTRADIAAAATQTDPMGAPLYPGTCRTRGPVGEGPFAWRLDVDEAVSRTGALTWSDELAGEQEAQPGLLGDVVLVRKDAATPASYHLAATLDDAADGVTLVTRGSDLFAATHVHRLLQELLSLPVPRWHHHALLVEPDGQKLAKRRGSGAAGFGLSERRLAGEDGPALAADIRAGRFPSGISLSPSLS
ncbi:tRNA glutamyl-Q(34) synthetase GluQRS [Paraurantiacibacter namhicola]|uniref:Glutamate--tRNA ligase n=1 Tax=Paraurantiacibacter namhicola TaxID=645517 RepID=A0A1C7D518_9SPHN|nr:tRNA glutamyl-Q(34) synthetase GluQRS [Paraurantiacibacter namhicola]ANU06567.1 Glutamate--tRNA ligase [Paraurantiacibacter namhicola]